MRTLTLPDGATIYYRDKGHGPAVILLHGFPLDHRMWDAQVDALAGEYRVIAPDLRGFGQSSRPAGTMTIAGMAADVAEIVRQLSLGKVVLGGLSMGGYVALAYVAAYPETLRGLMLFDTKAEADSAETKAGRDRMIDIAKRRGAVPIAEAMLGRMIPEAAAKSRPQLVRDLVTMMESTDPETIASALAAMRDRPDRTAELSAIKVPTLVVVGELDVITPPEVMKAMADEIPDSTLRGIPSAGHMSPMEQPQLVTHAVEQFLAGIG